MADDKSAKTEEVKEEVKVEESPVDESPKEEVKVEEPKEETEEVTPEEPKPEEPKAEEAEEETPPSRREQLRVQQLLRKYGPPPEKAPESPDFRHKVTADEDVYQILEETAKQHGQTQYQDGLKRAEFSTWQRFLGLDEKQIRSSYDVLNPAKPEAYHQTLEKTLQEKYLRFVGYEPGDPAKGIGPTVETPNISYAEFVEAEMEFADELASQKIAKTTQNIAKQAASTGLRPDGSSAKRLDLSKAPEEMTDEELSAAIGASLPRDTRGRFTSTNK